MSNERDSKDLHEVLKTLLETHLLLGVFPNGEATLSMAGSISEVAQAINIVSKDNTRAYAVFRLSAYVDIMSAELLDMLKSIEMAKGAEFTEDFVLSVLDRIKKENEIDAMSIIEKIIKSEIYD
jgi:hypothetical protein